MIATEKNIPPLLGRKLNIQKNRQNITIAFGLKIITDSIMERQILFII